MFFEWLGIVDPSLRQAMRSSLMPWFGTAAIALAVIAACSVAPGASRYFGLDAETAVLLWLAVFGFCIAAAALDRKVGFSPGAYGLAFVVSSGLVLTFAASLAALSRPPGSAVLAGIFVLTSGYYGHIHRSTARYPFGLGLVVFASLAALTLAPSPDSWSMLAVTGPIAVGANWLLGSIGYRAQTARLEEEALRAAVNAQILEAQSQELESMSGAMLDVLQTAHDASNALTAAMLNTETLRKSAEARARGENSELDDEEVATDLAGQLDRLRALIDEAKSASHGRGAGTSDIDVVELESVLGTLTHELRQRFATIEISSSNSRDGIAVLVRGGGPSLHRIIENVALNACLGDGVRSARRVSITVIHTDVGNSVAIEIRDDGPGFSAEQLEAPITAFVTTRADGTGLGLFTAERLARASGGSISRENAPDGGAIVTIFLAGVEPH